MERAIVANKSNYQEKLKIELEKIANESGKDSNDLSLEKKLIKAENETFSIALYKGDNVFKYFVIKISQYFIKDNGFRTDSYYSLISDRIYQLFYELLLNQNQSQFNEFQKGFANLYKTAEILFIC